MSLEDGIYRTAARRQDLQPDGSKGPGTYWLGALACCDIAAGRSGTI
jgi:hypothetical protein